ncbi:unnamed protein product, partial [Rotaria sordida]
VALLKQIDEWKTRTIERVTQAANNVRETVERLFNRKAEYDQIRQNIHRITKELREQQDLESFVESDIDRWMNQLKQLQTDFNQPLEVETNPPILLIQTIDWNTTIKITSSDEEPEEAIISRSASSTDDGLPRKSSQFHSQEEPYPSFLIGLNESIDREIGSLLKNLMYLAPMDKNGPMNGQCGPQTDQMEQFLSDAFGFKNILGKYIFPGIKSFQ